MSLIQPPPDWSAAVIGLDETGAALRTRHGDVQVPPPPTERKPALVELVIDDAMRSFLAKLCVITTLRGTITVPETTTLEPPVNLRGLGRTPCDIGAFSYSYSGFAGMRSVGRYCSLANDIVCAHVEHPVDWLSTSSFTYDSDAKGFLWRPFAESPLGARPAPPFEARRKTARHPREVRIGNDVWIGASVYIKGGITIGDSAIVGTRAVVTRDVPPFAVVGGNPARVIRLRFPEKIIARMTELRWWRFAFTDLGGIDIDDVERALDQLEARITSAAIRPYTPRPLSMRWIKETTDQLRTA